MPSIKEWLSTRWQGIRRGSDASDSPAATPGNTEPTAPAPDPIEALINQARYDYDLARGAATERLGELGPFVDFRVIDAILERCMDWDSGVRARAGYLVERFHVPADRQLNAYLTVMGRAVSDYHTLPTYAAEALGELGDPRAVQPLIDAMLNWQGMEEYSHCSAEWGVMEEPPVIACAKALGKLKDRRALQPLLKALAKYVGEWQQRVAVIEGLAALGDPSAIEPLKRVIEEEEKWPEIQCAAGAAIERLQDKSS